MVTEPKKRTYIAHSDLYLCPTLAVASLLYPTRCSRRKGSFSMCTKRLNNRKLGFTNLDLNLQELEGYCPRRRGEILIRHPLHDTEVCSTSHPSQLPHSTLHQTGISNEVNPEMSRDKQGKYPSLQSSVFTPHPRSPSVISTMSMVSPLCKEISEGSVGS